MKKTVSILLVMILMTGIGFLTSCQQRETVQPAQTETPAEAETETEDPAMENGEMTDRQKYINMLEQRVDYMEQQIAKMDKEAEEMGEEARQDYEASKKELQAQMEETRRKIKNASAASEDDWDSVGKDLDRTMESLDEAFHETLSNFSQEFQTQINIIDYTIDRSVEEYSAAVNHQVYEFEQYLDEITQNNVELQGQAEIEYQQSVEAINDNITYIEDQLAQMGDPNATEDVNEVQKDINQAMDGIARELDRLPGLLNGK